MNMTSDKLLELAERCEKAMAEQQSEVLEEAFRLCDPPPARMYSNVLRLQTTRRWVEWNHRFGLFTDKLACEAFLDAAMTLVPEGMVWGVDAYADHAEAIVRHLFTEGKEVRAAIPALALTAAALRARSQEGSSNVR
jgi:hypothetical protein